MKRTKDVMRKAAHRSRLRQNPDDQSALSANVPSFRPDLEGLRAVAVVLVLADHIVGWPTGGFIGVDIFFVLSGFLITGLLLKEHRRTGRISFRDFYVRRLKRIVPAAALVITVTCLASYVVFIGARVNQTLTDGLWAALFSANWRFVVVGQDYFAQDRAVSPFQHYWSLAVEEQFYLIWPLLVLFVLGLSRRRFKSSITTLTALLVIVTILSFGWACYQSVTAPTTAYFSTLTRAWELSAGALLAALTPRLLHRRPATSLALSTVGLAILIGGGVLLSPENLFPGPWAAVPVVGAMAVVVSGIGTESRGLNPLLTSASIRYVGRISFSLYLWHWPVVVLLAALMPQTNWRFLLAASAITAVLSILSFHLVEDPIRKSSWLTHRSSRSRQIAKRRAHRPSLHTVGLSSLALATILTSWFAVTSIGQETPDDSTLAVPLADSQPIGDVTKSEQTTIGRQVQAAIEDREWPEFAVPLDELESAKAAEWTTDECIDVDQEDLERCTYDASNEQLAVIVGDSVAISWMPGVRAALADKGYRTLSLTKGQCPASYANVASNDDRQGFDAGCREYHDWVSSTLEEEDPDLIITSSAENSLGRLISGATGRASEREWSEDTLAMLEGVAQDDRHVIILSPPPEGKNLQGCITRFNAPGDCTSPISDMWRTQSAAEKDAIERFDMPEQVTYVDTSEWFCNSSGVCPAYVDRIPVRADGNHLTDAYSRIVGPQLERVITESL